jgi:DNA-binding NtrC family response regulator
MLITRLPAEEAARAAGLKHVLVVDDDDLIRGVTQLLLEPYGLTVSSVPSGEAAVNELRKEGTEVDIVLLDCALKGETGIDVFQKLRAVRPTARIVFFSGFQAPAEIAELCQRGDAWFVQKPFKGADLVHLLARACATTSTNGVAAA